MPKSSRHGLDSFAAAATITLGAFSKAVIRQSDMEDHITTNEQRHWEAIDMARKS